MPTKTDPMEIPLQTGTLNPGEVVGRKVGLAEVKMLLAQVDSNSQQDTYLVAVAGDEVQILEVKARQPSVWLKKVILERLAKRGSGVEQA